MEIEPQNFFQTLSEAAEDEFKGPSECLRLLTVLNYNLTEEQLNSSVIDSYLLYMFDKAHGIFEFIVTSVQQVKLQKSSGKCLEIVYAVINNFPAKIEQFILEIHEKCLQILRTHKSADIKCKVLDVFLVSFAKVDKGLENQQNYQDLFVGLKLSMTNASHTDSVREKEFMVVGLFVRRFSYLVTDGDEIRRFFLGQLDACMVKGVSQALTHGIFTGLTDLCEPFPLNQTTEIERLYKHIKTLSQPDSKVKRGNRAALVFFSNNMNYFITYVIKEYKQWHKKLLVDWLKLGTEEKKVVEEALRSLLRHIALNLQMPEGMVVLRHFIGWFKTIIRNSKASHVEKKLLIQGLNYFTPPLYEFYSKNDSREIFLLIMRNFERTYIVNEATEDKEFLPDYVQCLASFMRFQEFTAGEVFCLQKAVIGMVKTFHNLKKLHHGLVIDALITTLYYLKETRHFEGFLESLVYQGVVWSCSHHHISEADVVTVKNYLPLWRGLLNPNVRYDINLDDRRYLLTKIVNQLVHTFMVLINKLNVSVTVKADYLTDIEHAYQVQQTSDYAIFLNLVDLYEDVFQHVGDLLQRCLGKMIKHVVAKCISFPLVSGFYRLLSFLLKLQFFDGTITINQDISSCQDTISTFLSYLLHKMKQFKDELLISCLKVFLESPVVVVEPMLPECASMFVMIFELGRSHIALADMGLSTLEKWQRCMDKEEFERFLLQVVPCLDGYLRSRSLGGCVTSFEKRRKTSRALQKRTILVELEPELIKFQKRVLVFIGSQNSKVCEAFVSPDHNFERKVTSENLHLKVPMAHGDLYVEPFIMRVVDLCLFCSDRKTRVMACEVLQAFTMVFLGRTKPMTQSTLSDLDDLFQNLAKPILCLACDVDQVARQIFEPLFLQMVHWYTSKVQRESPHLEVIVEVLLDGVSHPTNSSLRDFSGKSLKEFVKWTIKQSTDKELRDNPRNIKFLTKKIRFFSSHPDLVKKMGAALIFNNIYQQLREEESLINIFWIELTHIFLESLDGLEECNEVDNTVVHIATAIRHLKRVIMEKPGLFREEVAGRRVPYGMDGNLQGLCRWLLQKCASRSKHCRDICMELYIHLQPLCGSNESLAQFFQNNFIFASVEAIPEDSLLEEWLQKLQCHVDVLIFIVKNNLKEVKLEGAALEGINYFLKNLQSKGSISSALLKLTSLLLQNNISAPLLYTDNLWSLLENALFNPQTLNLVGGYEEVLQIILHKIPNEEFWDRLRRYLKKNWEVDADLRRNVSLKQRNLLRGLVVGGAKLQPEEFTTGLVDKFMMNLQKHSEDGVVYIGQMSEVTFDFCNLVLDIALKNPQELRAFLKYLFTPTPVITQELDIDSRTTLGEYVVSKFDISVKYILQDVDGFLRLCDNVDVMVKLVVLLLKGGASELVNGVVRRWWVFQEFFEENSIDQGLEFIRTLKSHNEAIQRWVVSLILREEILLTKNEGVNLYLNLFNVAVELLDDNVDNLAEVLDKFREKLQPIMNNPEKLLILLPKVQSEKLFTFLIDVYLNNPQDLNLSSLVTQSPQPEILNSLYTLALQTSFVKKQLLTNNILSVVFQNCSLKVFQDFFKEHIRDIVERVQSGSFDWLVDFFLIEVMFLRIDFEEGNEVEEVAGVKLRAVLVKVALDAFRVKSAANPEQSRVEKCAAYKALASIISNSIKKESFYEKLFIRQEDNEDILWTSLIDTTMTYNFPVDFEQYPKKRKILVNIRDELRQSRDMKYIESQRLYNSSLSEDMTKFDFTNSVLRTEGQSEQVQASIELEANEINNHELMGTVCGLIDHIFQSGINQLPQDQEDSCPAWMDGIRQLLLNEKTHKNVKLFWVKVIDNMIHVFRHFSHCFLQPLLQILQDEVAGNNLNYFVSDMIVILASWTSRSKPSGAEQALASKFLNKTIENLTNDRQDSFKYNLDLIKLIVENWREFIVAPCDILMNKLKGNIEDRKVEVGVHLVSIFLVNDLLPNPDQFWPKLLALLHSQTSSIYKPTSETLGLILKHSPNLVNDLNKILLNFDKVEKYAFCLQGVAIHYSAIVDGYHVMKMLNRLSQSDHNIQSVFLKIIFSGVEVLGEVDAFKSEDWTKFLESHNGEVQLVTLEIMLKTFPLLYSLNTFQGILRSISKNLHNPNSITRGRMYDIFMEIVRSDLDCDQDICQEVLVHGLVDADHELREKNRQFWNERLRAQTNLQSKFMHLIEHFYLNKTEGQFLGYIGYFLLDLPPSDDPIFDHPLEDCDFEEYKLQTNWRLQHPSTVPLFAETLRSQDIDSPDLNLGELRATQDHLSFAPTQSVREKFISEVTSLESSLGRGFEVDGSKGFLNPNVVDLSERYRLPKKRFLRDKGRISAGFAHMAVEERFKKVAKRYDAVKEGEKKVTIYRSYRKGDFPDIEISVTSLITPLQMLVLHDNELAKILFTNLYKALKTNLQPSDFANLSKNIQNIFTNSTYFNTSVMSTFLDILLESKLDMRIDPALICTVCQQSGLISVGTLLLEEYIGSLEVQPSSSKRSNGVDCETKLWLQLADLYKELNEWSLVTTIFLDKSNCKEDVQKALILESDKRWREAQEKYQQLLETDLSPERQDFYYESYFKCLAHLGEWDKLPAAVDCLVPQGDTWECLWDNGWFQQKILPWYLSAKVKNILFTGESDQKLLADINKSLANPPQADHLKTHYPEEMCLLWLTQKDGAQATQYLNSGLNTFLAEWQTLNPMFGKLRYSKVLNLRSLMEMRRFLSVDRDLNDLNSLLEFWRSTQREYLPIIFSEGKLLSRKLFGRFLADKLTELGRGEELRELKKTGIVLDMAFMNLALDEGNFYMTKKYYRPYAEMNHANLTMIYANLAILNGNLVRNDPGLKMEKLLVSLRKFKSMVDVNQPEQTLKALIKIFEVSGLVVDLTSNHPELCSRFEASLSEFFGCEDPRDRAAKILEVEALKDTSPEVIKEKIKALVALAYFVQDRSDQEESFVLYILRAMKLGSKEARQLFPRILLKESLGTSLKQLFIRETNDVPVWMFLGWIPQLLANADSSKLPAISDILLKLAKEYPQAVMYSYRLSKENYKSSFCEEEEGLREFLEEMDGLLVGDQLVDQFLTALSKVNVPLASIKHYLVKMFHLPDKDAILKTHKEVMEFFFGETPNSKKANNMHGNMYESILRVKNDLQKIPKMSLQDIKALLPTLKAKVEELQKRSQQSRELKDYCPWLANFSAGRTNFQLEIPGQYSGEQRPLVQHHVKISSFRSNVAVMKSLRQPIKVTVVGKDSKEYSFLVKFGEDIRQDQRIQQLFGLMNRIFVNDNKSHQILTYQVIPLTTSLGLIQWVDSTIALGDFILKSAVKLRNSNILERVKERYFRGLEGTNKTSDFDRYGMTALRRDRNKVIPFYRGLVNEVPLDILRTSIWSLSLTTENYIALRDNFIKSYATLSICHWLLGIGDRHLQNSKVSTRTGKVLGIDFGHAFGTATQILPIPELVPIRLTPHLVALMEPLKERGVFRDVMIECLRTLRDNGASLLATMNVFIAEPSVDWLEHSSKLSGDVWYPSQKIDQAKRKLQGASSVQVLVEDLRTSNFSLKKPEYFDKYVELVEGDPEFDLRARLKSKQTLSVKEQVDSLIDHATDPNLLGRMYLGWTSPI